jgi:NADH:ubiquinone oxidoreductase subunit C
MNWMREENEAIEEAIAVEVAEANAAMAFFCHVISMTHHDLPTTGRTTTHTSHFAPFYNLLSTI